MPATKSAQSRAAKKEDGGGSIALTGLRPVGPELRCLLTDGGIPVADENIAALDNGFSRRVPVENRSTLAEKKEVLDKRIYDRDEDMLFHTGAFGQNSSEFNLFNTDRSLSALQATVDRLRQAIEKKYLIYFASGLRLNQMENRAQMRATINAAVRVNVALFPIDTRGLDAFAPLGDASKPSPGGIGMYTGELTMEKLTSFQSLQDSLYALAADTGGKAMLDNNSLTDGIVGAQRTTTGYDTIGYYPVNTALDGKFHRLDISLREIPAAKLEFRNGYYAGKTFGKFSRFEKERQLEEALMLDDPITEVPIAMEINHFKLNRAEYFVTVHVKIP